MNIQHVARVANVSRGTVSRVLNRHPEVSPQTRERVLQVIQQLDYHPSELARGLINKSTSTVGLILPDIANPCFPELVRGALDVAQRHGFLVVVCNTDRSLESELQYVRMLRAFRAGGFVFAGAGPDDQRHLLKLQEEGVPAVLAYRDLDGTTLPSVTVDNVVASALATTHLISAGCRRLAFVTGAADAPVIRQRLEGFRRSLEAFSLRHDPSLVVRLADHDGEGVRQGTRQLLERPDRPDGIFYSDDLLAIAGLQAIRELGLRVPSDVAVVGFGDVPAAASLDPTLSTIRMPLYDLGAQAMSMLVDLASQKPLQRPRVILASKLIVRRSTVDERSRSFDSRELLERVGV